MKIDLIFLDTSPLISSLVNFKMLFQVLFYFLCSSCGEKSSLKYKKYSSNIINIKRILWTFVVKIIQTIIFSFDYSNFGYTERACIIVYLIDD